jgi:carbon monoxide dehydrogenase subunit G
MNSRLCVTAAVLCALAGPVKADFTYEETSKITGGMMAGMMKFAGVFSKQAREPMRSTVIVQGNRMAHVSNQHVQVIDIDKETFTDVDLDKKTYSVMTFADMQRALEELSRKMAQQKNDQGQQANMQFKVSVNKTGATQVFNGLSAQEAIMKLEMEGTDEKTGQKGGMSMISDMFLAPKVPGYEEVTGFYQRMAQKMVWSPMSRMATMMGASGSKGMAELYKEMSKLEGIPVHQVIRMGASGEQMQAASGGDPSAAAASQPAPAPPSGGEIAGGAAAGAASGRMGRLGGIAGGLGGFGGLGRKKKQQDEQAAAPPAAQTQQQGAPPQAAGVLMEITTDLTNFSSAPADSSKFEVPAGFKKVQNELEKQLK